MKNIPAAMLLLLLMADRSTQAIDLARLYPESGGPYMGDWQGTWTTTEPALKNGRPKVIDAAAQVIARGGGNYDIRLVAELEMRCPPLAIIKASEKGGRLVIENDSYRGEIADGVLSGGTSDRKTTFRMEKIARVSPTEGAKPPDGAVVLFDGAHTNEWQTMSWGILPGGVMQAMEKGKTLVTKRTFRDVRLHVEFRLPLIPEATGQDRGNSGVSLQDIFELQVLDSFGLDGWWNECGAIYKQSAPYVNMCYPPLRWQTYDIIYRAARFDPSGNITQYPRMTARHNGVIVQQDFEIKYGTSHSPGKLKTNPPKEPGHIKLQFHKGYVQYRNLWVEELDETPAVR